MIFNVMENKEELLFALKELNEGEVTDISSNLEQYILHVSKTGETMFAWQLIKPLLTQKLRRVSDDFYTEIPTDQLPSRPNMENVQYQDLQMRVIEHINKFSGTPFTIQRLCELLVNPRSHYTRPDKFLRGIEKIVMVVSTVEAMKVSNGSANSTSAALSDDEGSVSDAEKSVTGSGGLVNGVWGGPPTPPGAVMSPNRPSSPALDLTDRPDRPGPLSPTHPLSTTASQPHAGAGPEPDLSVSHLRPMGQLEAFVHNVSQRLSSTGSAPMTTNGTHSPKEAETEKEVRPSSQTTSEAAPDLPDSVPDDSEPPTATATADAAQEETKPAPEECDSSQKSEQPSDEPANQAAESADQEPAPKPDPEVSHEAESSSDERRDDRKRELSKEEPADDSSLSPATTSTECLVDAAATDEPPAKLPRLDPGLSQSSPPAAASDQAENDTQDDEVSESGQRQTAEEEEEEEEDKSDHK